MVTVKVYYSCADDIPESRIIVEDKEFDTCRIKGKKIDIWTNPFFIDGIKWNGFYAEMIKEIKSSKFVVVFFGQEEYFRVIKKSLDNHYISSCISTENSEGRKNKPSGTSTDTFSLAGNIVHVDPRFSIHMKLRDKYISVARELSKDFSDMYDKKIKNISDFACDAMTLYIKIMDCAYDRTLNIINNTTSSKININKNDLMLFCQSSGCSYPATYNQMCRDMAIEENIAEPDKSQNSTQNFIKNNEIKLNFRYRIMNYRKFREICSKDRLINCVYNDILLLINLICANTDLGSLILNPDEVIRCQKKAESLFKLIPSLSDESQILSSYISVFRLFPYNINFYAGYLRKYGDPDGELSRMAAFVNLDITDLAEKLIDSQLPSINSINETAQAYEVRKKIYTLMDCYCLSSCKALKQINNKINVLERTYKGVLYDTVEIKNLAQNQDHELAQKCKKLEGMGHEDLLTLRQNMLLNGYIENIVNSYIPQVEEYIKKSEITILDGLISDIEFMNNEQLDITAQSIRSTAASENISSTTADIYLGKVQKVKDDNCTKIIEDRLKSCRYESVQELDANIILISSLDCSQDKKNKYISNLLRHKRSVYADFLAAKIRNIMPSCSDFITITGSGFKDYARTEVFLDEYIKKYSFGSDEAVIAYMSLSNLPKVIYTNKRIICLTADRQARISEFIICENTKKLFANSILFSMKKAEDCFSFDIVNNRCAEGLCLFTNLFVMIVSDKNKPLEEMCKGIEMMVYPELVALKNRIISSGCSQILINIYLQRVEVYMEKLREYNRGLYISKLRHSISGMSYDKMCQKIESIKNHTDEEYMLYRSCVTEGDAISVVLSVKAGEDDKKLSELMKNAPKEDIGGLIRLKNEILSSGFIKSAADKYIRQLDQRISYEQMRLRSISAEELKKKFSGLNYDDMSLKLENIQNETDEDYKKYKMFISKPEIIQILTDARISMEDKILAKVCTGIDEMSYQKLISIEKYVCESQYDQKITEAYKNKLSQKINIRRKQIRDDYFSDLSDKLKNMGHDEIVHTIHAVMQSHDPVFNGCVARAEAVSLLNRVKTEREKQLLEAMFSRFSYMSTKEIHKLNKNLIYVESSDMYDTEIVKPYLKKIEKELREREKKSRKKGYVVCPNCGVPAKAGSSFCGACGARLGE